jgi:hypothetical protein
MKNSILIVASLAAVFSMSAAPAFAQRGRPSGTPGAAGGTAASGTHGSSGTAGEGHASSNATASPSSPSSVLSRNSSLNGALTKALGKSGINVTDLATTCGPFKNLGQCIAALHINHKFPNCTLGDLSSAKNLGQGIQGCNPQADAKTAKTEARNASKQANQEIKDAKSNS